MSLSIIKYPSGGGGGGGTVSNADNGLHLIGTTAKLGGNLLEATTITGDATAEAVTFTGVTENIAAGGAPNIANTFFKVQSTYNLSAPDPQFGVSLAVVAPADGLGNTALFTSGGDYGIIVDGLGTQGTGVLVQNNAGVGIQVAGTGASQGILVTGAATGIQVSGNGNFAVNANGGSFTAIRAAVDETTTAIPLFGFKNGNYGAGPLETMMILQRTTNAVVAPNYGITIDMKAMQVGGGAQNTIRLAAINANQANNTSKFQVIGLNAGTETNLFTVDALLNGRIGIGSTMTSPTARLHLPAGAAGAQSAPLKFTSGTNNTTAEAGAMEYNGTNLFFVRSGTTRESVLTGVSGATAPTATAGTTITNFYGSAATNFLGDPNSWASVVINGTTYKIPLYT